jgi:hypothetical protein
VLTAWRSEHRRVLPAVMNRKFVLPIAFTLELKILQNKKNLTIPIDGKKPGFNAVNTSWASLPNRYLVYLHYYK